eukprot:TCONS_00018712-protein
MRLVYRSLIYTVFFHQLVNTEEASSCYKSQKNLLECQILPYYLDYQEVKCMARAEIETESARQYICNSKTGYCWYPECQMRLTNNEFQREIVEACTCTEASKKYCKAAIDAEKRSCVKLTRYESYQWATCKKSTELVQKPMTSGCGYPEEFCWYPCQSERHGEGSGKVNSDCSCSDGYKIVPSLRLISFYTCNVFLLLKIMVY